MGTLLLIVFVKLRRQHNYSTSSGSSTTSESTIRSAATPLPIEDDGSSEPLNKQQRKKTTKPKRDNQRGQKSAIHVGRHDLICDGNPIPRCSCAAVCEYDSGSGSASDSSPQRRNSNLYRTLERTTIEEECDCPQCNMQRTCHEHFGSPEKKYFGDWMIQESYFEDQRHVNRRSFPQYV